VRDPFSRLESFFKNKFRKNIKEPDITQWEHCQEVFLQPLGIPVHLPYAEAKSRFLDVTFEDFISLLPQVYLKDAHLVPQWHSETLPLPFLKWKIQYDAFFKMENPDHLSVLEDKLAISLGERLNPTQGSFESQHWTPALRSIVLTLYKEDFQRYGYPTEPEKM
jgi:hypothetical protein